MQNHCLPCKTLEEILKKLEYQPMIRKEVNHQAHNKSFPNIQAVLDQNAMNLERVHCIADVRVQEKVLLSVNIKGKASA